MNQRRKYADEIRQPHPHWSIIINNTIENYTIEWKFNNEKNFI